MSIVPKVIRIVREGRNFAMTVDGEEFPYLVRDDDIEVSVARDRGGSVRLTLYADRVELVNDFDNPPDDDEPAPAASGDEQELEPAAG